MDILYIWHSINVMPYILYVLHVPLARNYDIPNQFVQLLHRSRATLARSDYRQSQVSKYRGQPVKQQLLQQLLLLAVDPQLPQLTFQSFHLFISILQKLSLQTTKNLVDLNACDKNLKDTFEWYLERGPKNYKRNLSTCWLICSSWSRIFFFSLAFSVSITSLTESKDAG